MGNHRAPRRATRRPSGATSTQYTGRRVAGREVHVELPQALPVAAAPVEAPSVQAQPVVTPAAEATHVFGDATLTAELPLPRAAAGKRKAVKHAAPRSRGHLPSPPLLMGVATLAVAVGGVLSSSSTAELAAAQDDVLRPATALDGAVGVGTVNSQRGQDLSRDSSREALAQANEDEELVAAAEAQVRERNAALGQLASQAEQTAKQMADNRWVLPLNPSITTATYGEVGLWATYHTGLDFNGENGDPISNVAPGTVTFTGYDGAYGNKTVVTLEDGTEIWYCHQTDIHVSEGDVVGAGEIIGTVGSTGHVTGSHLHLEVRPGGGDPVDPYAAFVVHGVTP